MTKRSGFTLIELLVVLAIIGLLIALLLPAVRGSREAARRSVCMNNLKQIGLALHNYHDTYKCFPPAYTVDADGKPLHSWRALILPYVEQQALYEMIDFSKPWDDPANQAVAGTALPIYHCPSADCPVFRTTYFALVTPESAMRPGASATLQEITDGASETLLVVEVDAAQSQPWMAPVDADQSMWLGWNETSKSSHTGGRQGLLADGAVRFLSNAIPKEIRQALGTINAGEAIDEF